MKRHVFSLFYLIMLISLLGGCLNTSENEGLISTEKDSRKESDYESKIMQLEKENDALKERLELQNADIEKVSFYEKAIQDLTAVTDDSVLTEFAKSQWEYNLTVNDQIISDNGKIEVDENDINISLTESQAQYIFISNDIFMKGKISDDYQDHMQNIKPEPNDITERDGTIITGVNLMFSNVKNGTEITFTITDELRDRLNLDTNKIIILRK